jgi:hypothetical protein
MAQIATASDDTLGALAERLGFLEAAMPVWRSAHAALAKVLQPEVARRLAIASEVLTAG